MSNRIGKIHVEGYADKNWKELLHEHKHIYVAPTLWKSIEHCPFPAHKKKLRITIEEI